MKRIEGLDPGITKLVHLLANEWGYNTCDSGDGVSKPVEAQTVEGPHVVMHLGGISDVGGQMRRLIHILEWNKVTVPYEITVTYATNGPTLMMLCGVSDKDLHPKEAT